MTSPAVRLRAVSVVRDGAPIVDCVDWDVGPGERWVLLGPNGSGKTTLLQVAGARLLPTAGTAEVVGERLGRVDMRVLRGRVALVSGALVRQLRPSMTALEVVVTGCDGILDTLWRRVPPADWARAGRALAQVAPGAEDGVPFGSRHFGILSEGERQLVLIARALVGASELLLLDEPAAGLDLGARERLLARLAGLAADPAVPAMVLVTHHVEEIPPGFTHAALLRGGRLVASGPLEAVLTSESISSCFATDVRVARHRGRWSVTASS